jgi:hypothetical protein
MIIFVFSTILAISAQFCEENSNERCNNDQVKVFIKLSAENQAEVWNDNKR